MNSNTTDAIIIPLSKTKGILLLFGAIAFVAMSIWMWPSADSQTRFNPLEMKVVAVAGVSFFGLCALYGFYKIFDMRPGLIIDAQGILDNSSAIAAGQIRWDEITGWHVSEIAGQRMVTIEVVDPQRFVDRGNFISRKLNSANTKMTGSPINISSVSLRIGFDELVQTLNEAFEKHRRLEKPTRTAYRENAPGPFYSECDGCVICGAPHEEAPELMAWDPSGNHCFFKRQPETPEEVQRAINAMDVSCVENLRYRGDDPEILETLCRMGYRHLCDALE